MSKQQVEVIQDFSRPIEAVFAELADHNNLRKVFGIPVKRVRDGQGHVNGVGSVRRLGLFSPLAVEETVLAMEPNASIDYEISKGGFPLRNHHGRLTFSKTPTGTRVCWSIVFDSALPVVGTVARLVLSQGLALGLKRVA